LFNGFFGPLILPAGGLELNAREKTWVAGEKFEDFETHFRIK
jgi:hypothetical protein